MLIGQLQSVPDAPEGRHARATAVSAGPLRRAVGFSLCILVTAALLVRPADLLPSLEHLPIYNVLIIACLVVSLPEVLRQLAPQSLSASPITVCVIGILAVVAVTNFAHFPPDAAAADAVEFAKVLLYYLLLVGLIDGPARLTRFLGCVAACLVLVAVVPLLQHRGVIELRTVTAVDDVGVDRSTGEQVVHERLRGAGIFNDPNDLSHILGFGVLLCLYGPGAARSGVRRVVWCGPLLVLAWAMALTQSRGGLLALAGGIGTLCVLRFGWRTALVLGTAALPVVATMLSGRLADISTDAETGQERIQLWSDALDFFRAHPLLGIGKGNFNIEAGLVAHNSFLQCFAELGWFGGAFFVGAFYLALRLVLARPAARRVDDDDREMVRLRPYLAAAIAAYVGGMMTLTRSFQVPTYLVLGLAAAYGRVAPAGVRGPALRSGTKLAGRLAVVGAAFLVAAWLWVRASVNWG